MSAATLSVARAAVERQLLRDTCTIVTPSARMSDGGGGLTDGTPTTATAACSLTEVSGDEATTDVIAVRGRYRLSLPYATTIGATCRVQLSNVVYQVVWAPTAGALALTRVVGLKDAPGVALV